MNFTVIEIELKKVKGKIGEINDFIKQLVILDAIIEHDVWGNVKTQTKKRI